MLLMKFTATTQAEYEYLSDDDCLAYKTYCVKGSQQDSVKTVHLCGALTYKLTHEVTNLQAIACCCAEIANCWQLFEFLSSFKHEFYLIIKLPVQSYPILYALESFISKEQLC